MTIGSGTWTGIGPHASDRPPLAPQLQDAWIAATARAHDVAVYTQDDDFDALAVATVRV